MQDTPQQHIAMLSRTISILSLFLLSACYHDNEEALAPCSIQPGSVRYTDVTVIFNRNGCYGCHAGAAVQGNIHMDAYADIKALVDNGRLVGAITHATGYAPMPQGGPMMDACDINRIKAWIAAGAKAQ